MRFTLACSWCRKAKVKCRHDGVPPCRGCSLNRDRECILSYPPKPPNRHRAANASIRRSRVAETLLPSVHAKLDVSTDESGRASEHIVRRSNAQQDRPWSSPAPVVPTGATTTITAARLVRDIGVSAIIAACLDFSHLFPDFGFLHQPTLLHDIQQNSVDPVKIVAILMLCAAQTSSSTQAPSQAEQYAEIVRRELMTRVTDSPNVDVVQALAILSLYDWGNASGFRAWMYLGMAIRMGETLLASSKTIHENDAALSREILHRTMWSCFIMDCILSCGKGRKESFAYATVPFPLPVSEDDFAFLSLQGSPARYLKRLSHNKDTELMKLDTSSELDAGNYQSIIIQGFDICSTVSNWITNGGRRQEARDESGCPWHEASQWNRGFVALEQWKRGICSRLIYSSSNNNLSAFVLRRQGPAFAMINLLYHVTNVFLHREFTPFLPHRVQKPQGPIDPPFLSKNAPPGWWENSSRSLYDSAATIVDIVRELEDNRVILQTPLIGFWMYTASIALHYACSWPHMAPGTPDMRSRYEWAFKWLRDVRLPWKICEGWHKTMEKVDSLVCSVKQDPSRYLGLSRDNFTELEDNIQRLAEVETSDSDSGSGDPASILIALSRSNQTSEGRANRLTADENQGPAGIETIRPQIVPPASELTGQTDTAYDGSITDDLDELMRMFFANQDSITTLISDPILDGAFAENGLQ